MLRSPRVARRRRIVFRFFALALMAVIAGDLVDTACDPLPRLTEIATIAGESGADADQSLLVHRIQARWAADAVSRALPTARAGPGV